VRLGELAVALMRHLEVARESKVRTVVPSLPTRRSIQSVGQSWVGW
jgi:hypothetical protein